MRACYVRVRARAYARRRASRVCALVILARKSRVNARKNSAAAFIASPVSFTPSSPMPVVSLSQLSCRVLVSVCIATGERTVLRCVRVMRLFCLPEPQFCRFCLVLLLTCYSVANTCKTQPPPNLCNGVPKRLEYTFCKIFCVGK